MASISPAASNATAFARFVPTSSSGKRQDVSARVVYGEIAAVLHG
jgi:hypothetical protein